MAEGIDPINWAHIKEQMESHLVDMAKLAGAYMEQLQVSGFIREEAFTLVRDYMKSIMKDNADNEQNPID